MVDEDIIQDTGAEDEGAAEHESATTIEGGVAGSSEASDEEHVAVEGEAAARPEVSDEQRSAAEMIRKLYDKVENTDHRLAGLDAQETREDILRERDAVRLELQGILGDLQVLNGTVKEMTIDPVTGLSPRIELKKMMAEIDKQAQAENIPFSVLMIDLDHFKIVNDTYGHRAGDEVLRQFAEIIKHCIRGEDTAYRYGGDEFIVILKGASEEQAAEAAERIRNTIEETIIPLKDGRELKVTASIGFAEMNREARETIGDTIERADAALYEAKRGGRSRAVRA
jgi:diguanylate cyclase (GGDEF)-like protein